MGDRVGAVVGVVVGSSVGDRVGSAVGTEVGLGVGTTVGFVVACAEQVESQLTEHWNVCAVDGDVNIIKMESVNRNHGRDAVNIQFKSCRGRDLVDIVKNTHSCCS